MTDIAQASLDGTLAAIGAVTALLDDQDDPTVGLMFGELDEEARYGTMAWLACSYAKLLALFCTDNGLDPRELLQTFALDAANEASA